MMCEAAGSSQRRRQREGSRECAEEAVHPRMRGGLPALAHHALRAECSSVTGPGAWAEV